MALISNGTTIASGGSLSVSANPPSTAGAVGTYGFIRDNNAGATTSGTTASSSVLYYSNAVGTLNTSDRPSGTWRQMGYRSATSNSGETTLFIRIS